MSAIVGVSFATTATLKRFPSNVSCMTEVSSYKRTYQPAGFAYEGFPIVHKLRDPRDLQESLTCNHVPIEEIDAAPIIVWQTTSAVYESSLQHT